MEAPAHFEDGMTARTVLGGFFIGFLMMPGAIYMGLMAGSSLGPAAEWVTIILFAEVARRSFAPLGRQEIYVLYYIAGGLTHEETLRSMELFAREVMPVFAEEGAAVR